MIKTTETSTCKFCCMDGKIIKGKSYKFLNEKFESAIYLSNKENSLNIEFGDAEILKMKINYCPLCNRKLE